MKIQATRILAAAAACALAALPHAALACDACMGGKDPQIRPAVNGAIFFMLGMVALMATCVGLFMRYLAKRANMPLAPHDQLLMSMPEGQEHA